MGDYMRDYADIFRDALELRAQPIKKLNTAIRYMYVTGDGRMLYLDKMPTDHLRMIVAQAKSNGEEVSATILQELSKRIIRRETEHTKAR